MNINLHIDAIVLEGVQTQNATAVHAAVESELSYLLTTRPLRQHPATTQQVAGHEVTIDVDDRAQEIGRKVAYAIYESLQKR